MKNRWFIVDAHLDIAYNAIGWGRDYSRSAQETRDYEAQTNSPAIQGNGNCSVGLPDFIAGGVGIVFGTLFVAPQVGGMSVGPLTYRNPDEAHELGMKQLDYYHEWAGRDPRVRVIGTRQDLEAVVKAWQPADDAAGAPQSANQSPKLQVGVVPLMEGADPIRTPEELSLWVERGLRAVGLAWTGTRYSGGTRAPGGLTDLGRALIKEIARLDVLLDVSHMAPQAVDETLDLFEGKFIIASHSNAQHYLPTERHLTDAAIKGIARRGGVIGTVLANGFLLDGWGREGMRNKNDVTLEHVTRAIDYVCQLTGSHTHAGIGSDFDGGFGVEAIPAEFDTSRDLYKIGDALLGKGYTEAQVADIMGGNWLRILRAALK